MEGFKISPSTLAEINAPLEDKVYFAVEAHDANRQLGLPGAVFSGSMRWIDAVDRLLS